MWSHAWKQWRPTTIDAMALSFLDAKVVIRCANLNASGAFYTGVLGLQVVEQWDEPEGRGLIVAVGEAAGR
jgi:hypothetical protein